MPLLIHKSWVVFIYAITLSLESILIEYLTTTSLQIPPIMLSAISITLAGIMLSLIAAFFMKKKGISTLFSKSWKNLILASFLLAIGIFTWYDSISRIGASKEALIAGPLEIVIIVVLARIFLNENLDRIQVIGIVLALIGFLMAIASDAGDVLDDDSIGTVIASPSTLITFGDIEAIFSALGFAIGVLFLTKLVSIHSSIEVAGASMLVSGLILVAFMIGFLYESQEILSSSAWGSSFQQQPLIITIIILLLFSFLPFIGSLCYTTGLSKIGASITATIGSSTILITILIQIILKELGITSNLPEDIFLAILGGVLGFLGIYVIHMHTHYLSIIPRRKQ
ncbi:MAG TPA: DMT family transporter [Nitrososphaeraceae archaeon]|nr:DMT family transporter [Nitrososphaeraceae archaeon]